MTPSQPSSSLQLQATQWRCSAAHSRRASGALSAAPAPVTHGHGGAPGEDLWHCYNLIREGDHVTATTFRKVARDSGAGSESEKVRLRLTIAIEGVDFDPEGAPLQGWPASTRPRSAPLCLHTSDGAVMYMSVADVKLPYRLTDALECSSWRMTWLALQSHVHKCC